MSPAKKILLQVNGSIAAFKAVSLVSSLVKEGFEVEVVLSEGAKEFVGAASFEGFTRKKVYSGTFDEGSMMSHIDLERWADLIIAYPATANSIAKMANGIASDLAATIFLAHDFKKPYLVAPAMNQTMWNHPIVKLNVEKLSLLGIKILEPAIGSMACGEEGLGRLIEPEAALQKIHSFLSPPKSLSKRILITSGGTVEPIDPIRQITNVSTGKTGHTIAKTLEDAGHEVHLVQSVYSRFQSGLKSVSNYKTSQELAKILEHKLSLEDFDFVIHAAAVSDFKVENPSEQKIKSAETLHLKLVPTPKIIQELRYWSKNKDLKLISFKLTAGSKPELENYNSDFIIHNELKNVSETKHEGTLYERALDGSYVVKNQFSNKQDLSKIIQSLVQEGLFL